MINKNSNWVWAGLALVLAAGCAHEQAQPQQSAQAPQPGLSPTSDRPEPRVYAESPATTTAPQDPGAFSELPATTTDNQTPKGAPSEDWALAQEIRATLTQDKTLAAAPMQAYVDKGVVTLRGFARNERERKRLHESVAALPGVKSINDQIEIRNSLFGWGGTSR